MVRHRRTGGVIRAGKGIDDLVSRLLKETPPSSCTARTRCPLISGGSGTSRPIDAYDFQRDKWDDGFGWHQPCDVNRPFARALAAIHMMSNIDLFEGTPVQIGLLPTVRWAGRYAASRIDDFRARCSESVDIDGVRVAVAAKYVSRVGTDRVYWFMPAAYGIVGAVGDGDYTNADPGGASSPVVSRAGTMLHEARHSDKSHNADDDCLRGASCDSSWEYSGANAWQLSWLMEIAYYHYCPAPPAWGWGGVNVTDAQAGFARDEAAWLAERGFETLSFSVPDYRMRCL